MGKFLRRAVLFSLPFIVYAALIFLADPFNFTGAPSFIRNETKFPIAAQLNPCFWKMNLYRRDPQSKLLLGDSRMLALTSAEVKEISGESYFNFAYGGASLREMIDTFWFASRQTRLENVYLGINLNLYNDYNITERTKLFSAVEKNPALYLVNRTVLEAAFYDAYSQFTGTDLKLGVPTMSREEFWRDQLQNVNSAYYKSYVSPTNYKRELRKISDYCKEHGVQLSFIIFPSHADARQLIADFHLERENATMRTDLAALGPIYDFDYANDLTANSENFSDPNHYTKPVGELLIREVWLGQTRYARKYE